MKSGLLRNALGLTDLHFSSSWETTRESLEKLLYLLTDTLWSILYITDLLTTDRIASFPHQNSVLGTSTEGYQGTKRLFWYHPQLLIMETHSHIKKKEHNILMFNELNCVVENKAFNCGDIRHLTVKLDSDSGASMRWWKWSMAHFDGSERLICTHDVFSLTTWQLATLTA